MNTNKNITTRRARCGEIPTLGKCCCDGPKAEISQRAIHGIYTGAQVTRTIEATKNIVGNSAKGIMGNSAVRVRS